MTNVTFDRKEFEKHVKITDEVIEKISLFGTPLEKIDESIVEIEVFPNRPDLISLEGFMRSFKAFIGKETGMKKYKLRPPQKNYRVGVDTAVKNIRPYTVCAIVKGLKLDDTRIKSIIELQEKLHITLGRNRKKMALGVYPLDKIKLPIKYTAKKPTEIKFIPLEFDKEMNGKQILQKHPVGKRYADLLRGQNTYPVFVDASGKVLSMPPIINSNETGRVTDETRDVFIECSGSDLGILKKTLNIVVTTLADMGGEIYQMEIMDKQKLVTPDMRGEKIKFSIENASKLLGIELKEKDCEKLLRKMGYDVTRNVAIVPPWRVDVLHEVDIIEDIAIAYGYDKIEAEIPNVSTIGSELPLEKLKNTLAELLVGLGFNETMTYHLIKKDEAKIMQAANLIEVENSKTEYKLLRPNLFIPALRTLAENKDSEYPQKIFELGRAFEKNGKGITEKDKLVVAITPSNFTTAKQHLDYLMRMLGIEYNLNEKKIYGLIDGRTGEIIVDGKAIGYIGEVHPNTLRKWYLKMPLAVFEIDLNEFWKILESSTD